MTFNISMHLILSLKQSVKFIKLLVSHFITVTYTFSTPIFFLILSDFLHGYYLIHGLYEN